MALPCAGMGTLQRKVRERLWKIYQSLLPTRNQAPNHNNGHQIEKIIDFVIPGKEVIVEGHRQEHKTDNQTALKNLKPAK